MTASSKLSAWRRAVGRGGIGLRWSLVFIAVFTLNDPVAVEADEGGYVRVSHGVHRVQFSRQGARPIEWNLYVSQGQSAGRKRHEILISSANEVEEVGQFFALNIPGLADVNQASFDVERISKGRTLELRFTSAMPVDGIRVVKTYQFDDRGYRVGFSVEIRNLSDAAVQLGDGKMGLGIVFSSALGNAEAVAQWRGRLVGISATGVIEARLDEETPIAVLPASEFDWAGVESRYLLLTMRPVKGTKPFTALQAALEPSDATGGAALDDRSRIRFELDVASVSIAAGASARFDFEIYAGPKLGAAFAGDPALSRTLFADIWNWMRWLCRGLAWLLDLIHHLIPSWGMALIALAVVVRILLLPITIKAQMHQARVMVDQARLKPLLDRINAEHSGVEARHEATRRLYDEQGASMLAPMMGCLWIFVQIPIFIALYFVIGESYDLSGAGFLWIDDLARPDRLVAWGVDLPYLGTHLNVLPFLMALSQIAATGSAQLPGADSAQLASQRKWMIGMAVVFFFLLYNFPAGLMLYWLVSNVLQSSQQMLLSGWVGKRATR